MRKAFYASAIALLGLAAVPVQAMTIAPLSGASPDITLVAGGCGAGFHRGPYGGCVRNAVVAAPGVAVGVPGVAVAAPAVVAPRTYFMYGGRRCYWARPGVRTCI
jgi:hypothetical protein